MYVIVRASFSLSLFLSLSLSLSLPLHLRSIFFFSQDSPRKGNCENPQKVSPFEVDNAYTLSMFEVGVSWTENEREGESVISSPFCLSSTHTGLSSKRPPLGNYVPSSQWELCKKNETEKEREKERKN